MRHEPGCIFCRIVRGEAPCHRVAEDDLTLAFMDILPVSDGHVLVVTREHFQDLFEATPEAIAAVGAMSQRVAGALRRLLEPAGLSVYQANGTAAGQTVFHYHMHLMPRAEGSALRFHGREPGDPEALARRAAEIGALVERG